MAARTFQATLKDIRDGLDIIAKYEEYGEDAAIGGIDKNILFAGSNELVNQITIEDKKVLNDLGWFEYPEIQGFGRIC